jgi:hypothetical protein
MNRNKPKQYKTIQTKPKNTKIQTKPKNTKIQTNTNQYKPNVTKF